jgi:hypothetical protein
MREKGPKTLHFFFYFLQNGVELTLQYVLYLSPRLDTSSDHCLKFNHFPGVSRSLQESERFSPTWPISLYRSIIILCSTNTNVFPKAGVF